MQQVRVCDEHDHLITWKLNSSRCYFISSAWNALRDKSRKFSWNKLVKDKCTILKFSFIVWLALMDRLVIRSRSFKWKLIENDLYHLYRHQVETVSHLFFRCEFIKKVWIVILYKCSICKTILD